MDIIVSWNDREEDFVIFGVDGCYDVDIGTTTAW